MAVKNRPGFRQILCPVDFSSGSRNALRYAAMLAERSRGRLTVLFVNDPMLDAAAAAAAYDTHAMTTRTRTELSRLLRRTLGDAADSVSVLVALGNPAREIRGSARKIGADLIVMGSRGLTAFNKWFFGSTTERMLRTSTIPILVVPDRPRLGTDWPRRLRTWPGKRVLVPIDVADVSDAELRAAVAVARRFDAKPLFVHAISPAMFPNWLRIDASEQERARADAARATLRRMGQKVGDATSIVEVGEPARVITKVARRTHAGLVVLTLKRSPGPFGPRRGSITYRVLCEDVVPLFALPEGFQVS